MTDQHLSFPIKTGAGLNDRYAHPAQRARVVKAERQFVAWSLVGKKAPTGPVVVLIVRVSPSSKGLDKDNLQGSMKAVRDELAVWLGRDDADESITWDYGQRPGKFGKKGKLGEWAVEVHVSAAA